MIAEMKGKNFLLTLFIFSQFFKIFLGLWNLWVEETWKELWINMTDMSLKVAKSNWSKIAMAAPDPDPGPDPEVEGVETAQDPAADQRVALDPDQDQLKKTGVQGQDRLKKIGVQDPNLLKMIGVQDPDLL